MLGKTTTKKNLKRKRKWAILSLDSLIRARQTSSVITERTVTKRAKILTLTSLHLASMNDKTMSKTKSITRIINKFRRVVLSVRLPRLAKSAYIRCCMKMRKVTQIAIVTKIHSKSGSAIRMQRTQMLTLIKPDSCKLRDLELISLTKAISRKLRLRNLQRVPGTKAAKSEKLYKMC